MSEEAGNMLATCAAFFISHFPNVQASLSSDPAEALRRCILPDQADERSLPCEETCAFRTKRCEPVALPRRAL